MKTFAFAVLTGAIVAADVNPNIGGPKSAPIASSTIRFTPTVTEKTLKVVMDLAWIMSLAGAINDVTEMTACWQ